MKSLTEKQIAELAIDCGIDASAASILARKTLEAIEEYTINSQKGAYDQNGNLASRVDYGENILQQKKQRRRTTLYFPHPARGRPKNEALVVLISFIATAFTKAGGAVTLNQEGAKASRFEKFISPICHKLGLFNIRDYISNHLLARKTK